MAATATHLLNRVLAVWREQVTVDAVGGQTFTHVQVADVPARVSRASATERDVAQQEGAEISHDIYLAPGADVARGDELRGDGDTFQVIAVVEPSEAAYRKAEARQDVPS